MRPSPGYLPVFQGDHFEWDNGVLKGSYKTFSVPAQEGAAATPVSAGTMLFNSRDVKPPYSDFTPFQGPRSFEFTLDEGPPMLVQVDFAPSRLDATPPDTKAFV